MAYEATSIYESGSTIFYQRSPKNVVVVSQKISSSLNANYTILAAKDNPGNFIPHKIHFYYDQVGTNASTAARYHLGYTPPNYNDYISSGTLNGVTDNVFTNSTLPAIAGNRPMSGSSDLVVRFVVQGTNIPTGSFVIFGTSWDY